MNKANRLLSSVIIFLCIIGLLIVGLVFEMKREHDNEVFELRTELIAVEDLYQKAVWHIELMNKEREVE